MVDPRSLIRPGVAGIIIGKDGRILLHRRKVGNGWAPPSGRVEFGESVVTAIQRELKEETQIEVEIIRLVGVYSDPALQIIEFPNGSTIHFVTCLFLCTPTRGTLTGSDEGHEWRWFYPDGLPQDLLPYAGIWITDAYKEPAEVTLR